MYQMKLVYFKDILVESIYQEVSYEICTQAQIVAKM